MADLDTVDETKMVLSEQEWNLLPDDVKAAFEQDGDNYVADEQTVAELTKRTRESEQEDGADEENADDPEKQAADDDGQEQINIDDLPDIVIELPDTDYDRLPVDMRVLYERKDGKWVAIPELRVEIERIEAKYKPMIAEIEAETAAKQASIESMECQLRDLKISHAVTDVLAAAGCKPGLIKAAIAMFVKSHTIHAERKRDGSYDITVEGGDGIIDLPTAVELWLLTEDGRALLKQDSLLRVIH